MGLLEWRFCGSPCLMSFKLNILADNDRTLVDIAKMNYFTIDKTRKQHFHSYCVC